MPSRRILAPLLAAGLCVSACGAPSGEGDGSGSDAGRGRDVTTVDGTATSAAAGGCTDEVDNAAAPVSHVESGTDMSYAGVPPVSGAHWLQYPDISKTVYPADERPPLGQLVHSQEHGWTMVWYDDSIACDGPAMAGLTDVATEVAAANPAKVVFVPWTSLDGDAFSGGAHLAITHWDARGDGIEYRQFCAAPNADAVLAFSMRHPSTDSSEPAAP